MVAGVPVLIDVDSHMLFMCLKEGWRIEDPA